MLKNKSKKSSMSNGFQQMNISSFFSSKMASNASKRSALSSAVNLDVPSMGECGSEETENVPLSPEPSAVPETPDSQIRPSKPARAPHDGTHSPVSRSPHSRGLGFRKSLMTRRPMQLLGNGSPPLAEDPPESKNGGLHGGSVKRPMFCPEDFQETKRLRTMPVRSPSSGSPGKKNQHGPPGGDGLSELLQVIRDSTGAKVKAKPRACLKGTEEKKLAKTGLILFEDASGAVSKAQATRRETPSLKPLMDYGKEKTFRYAKPPFNLMPLRANGASSVSSKGDSPGSSSSESEERENVFTLIAEQKADVYKAPRGRAADGELVVSYSCVMPNGHVGEMDSALQCAVSNKGRLRDVGECQDKAPGADENAVISENDLQGLEDSWFDDKMEQSFAEPNRKKSKSEKPLGIPDHVLLSTGLHNRFWVLHVQEASGSRGYLEKHLTVTASKTTQPTELCILKDSWESTPVAVGDVVHLEGECVSGMWVIGRDSGFLVLLPDLLISGTSIASSIRCMRRAVLGEMFKTFDGGSKQMLNGTIVHEIFQKAAMCLDFSPGKLQQLADDALLRPEHLGTMYTLKLTQADMKQEVKEYLPALSEWAADYVHTSPLAGRKQLTLKLPSDGALSRQDSACSITLTDFLDIEENIWSPRFGLKGKIDVTASVRIHRRGWPHLDRVVPLELKTGKESNSIEHRSQVILYTLMSLERRSDAEAGFLLYLKTGKLHPIVGNHMDRRELVKLRNSLAHHLGNSLVKVEGKMHMAPLPAVISDQQACKYCPQMRNCAFYNRAMERASGDPPPQQPFLEQESQHLREPHLHYLSHWLLLCALEARTMEARAGRRNIWLQSAQDREKSGGCVGNLLRSGPVSALSDGTYGHCFEQKGAERGLTGLVVGDRIVVSDQDSKLIAVASGYVTEMTGTRVTCSLDRNLSKYSSDIVFRLDQDEGVGGMTTHLGNLSMLMGNSPTSERLRELIVEFRPPQFIESLSSVLPRDAKDTVANILKGLNKPQKQAMKKVLLSKDYTLIVGMPGTGKTTTICTLVRILHACGFSVLLTSYTHSAVDNILLKLRKFKIGFLRLGRTQKVHRDILPYTEEQCRASGVQTLAELEHLYNRELVVATTCMGVKHAIFTRRRFDFCIVDEASQISQPVCMGPLFHAERFVLVGDHQQLPPIVQNAEARALGMDESLFKRLEQHSEAVVQLNVQYRMNSKIMSLSNSLMYGGRLECGSERTASAVLALPGWASAERELERSAGKARHGAWLHAALEPQNPVCFLDTTQVPAMEMVEKGGVSNQVEAVLVHAIVSLLLKAGCRAADIGVIAPYRQQLKVISGLLEAATFRAVEVNTVDKYQGRDKNVIIVSFVRCNLEGNLGELLKDWRRLNVAITRAKHKLLMVGSASTLRHYAPLEKLLTHLQREDMIFQLPLAAHETLPRIHL